MGRKTFDSLGRALPGRTSIVLSRQQHLALPPGVLQATTMERAMELCENDPEPFVIGGAEIYRLALRWVSRAYVTRIDASITGDTYFAEGEIANWKRVAEEHHPADAKNEYPHVFEVRERSVWE
jgi:dihydrofolate reductase